MSMCQCAACGAAFGSLSAFDRHQDWDYKRRPMLICRDPASVGLRLRDGVWRAPLSAARRDALKKMTAERAATHT